MKHCNSNGMFFFGIHLLVGSFYRFYSGVTIPSGKLLHNYGKIHHAM